MKMDTHGKHRPHNPAGVSAGLDVKQLVEDQHADPAGKVAEIYHQKPLVCLGGKSPQRAQQIPAEAEQHGKTSLPFPALIPEGWDKPL